MKKKDSIQLKNPRTNRYVKINKITGKITSKKTDGPYKNIKIIKRPNEKEEIKERTPTIE